MNGASAWPLVQLAKGAVVGGVIYYLTSYLEDILSRQVSMSRDALDALIFGARMVLVLAAASAGWLPTTAISSLVTMG